MALFQRFIPSSTRERLSTVDSKKETPSVASVATVAGVNRNNIAAISPFEGGVDSNTQGTPPATLATPATVCPGRSECYCCKRVDYWHSIHGGTFCRRCHPPVPGTEAGS